MSNELIIPTMAQMAAEGKQPEILFWVGCAGSFDQRAQKITRDICKILQHVGIIKVSRLGANDGGTIHCFIFSILSFRLMAGIRFQSKIENPKSKN